MGFLIEKKERSFKKKSVTWTCMYSLTVNPEISSKHAIKIIQTNKNKQMLSIYYNYKMTCSLCF